MARKQRIDSGGVKSFVLLAALGLSTIASRSLANQESPTPLETSGLAARDSQEKEELPLYWSQGDPRWFVAGELWLGPALISTTMAGYGKPHWTWIGIEGYAITTTEFGGGYAGVQANMAVLMLQAGVREFLSYDKSELAPQKKYSKSDLNLSPGEVRAQHWSFEVKLSGLVPLSPFYAFLELVYSRMLDPPAENHVFDEYLRCVLGSPNTFSARIAAALGMGRQDRLILGVINEYVYLPERWREHQYRLGPVGFFSLTDHVQLFVYLTFPIGGPDELGAMQGMYGSLGAIYRFAGGEGKPGFR
jgi:hypothetical protein